MVGKKQIIGTLFGVFVFVIIPESIRWAFAQNQQVAQPQPQGKIDCSVVAGRDINGPVNNDCGNTYFAPQKWKFKDDIAHTIINRMEPGIPIRVAGVGSKEDLETARQFAEYFKNYGREVSLTHIPMMAPAPEKKWDILALPGFYVVTIAPSAP